jgi:Holliday junction resolvase RusA-like endonuclease
MPPLGILPGSFIGPVAVKIVFHPAVDRNRDLDNMQASQKAALDGIALALGVDDSIFCPVSEIGSKRKPACVVVTLTPAAVALPVRGVIR